MARAPYIPPPKSRTPVVNPMALAASQATKLSEQEVSNVIGPVREAVQSMKSGTASALDWNNLRMWTEMALQVEKLGVVKGLKGELNRVVEALRSTRERSYVDKQWSSPALSDSERAAFEDFLAFYEFQMRQVSAGEFKTVFIKAVDKLEPHKSRQIDVIRRGVRPKFMKM